MFSVNNLFNTSDFCYNYSNSATYSPLPYEHAQSYLSKNIVYYTAGIGLLTCGYIFRHKIAEFVKQNKKLNTLVEKYLPSIFPRIQVNSQNSYVNAFLKREFNRCLANFDKEGSYTKKGRIDYEFPATFYGLTDVGKRYSKINALDVVSKKMQEKKDPIKVLDLGTGNGAFIFNLSNLYPLKVEAHGVSAFDTRDKLFKENLSKDIKQDRVKYYVGNIEALFEISAIKRNYYDLIISSFCFMHLTDPIKALINAYEALKEGGELYIDHFCIKGLDIEQLRSYLKLKGYNFELVGQKENVDYIHITKNQPRLDLPIVYDSQSLYDDSIHTSLDRIFIKYAWAG